MSLQGLPDFHLPTRTEQGVIYYPYEGAGNHSVTPSKLEVATQEDGRPDFHLSFIRGPNPALPPTPHGILNFRLKAHYEIEAALDVVRRTHSNATVTPSAFTGGWFRLYPAKPIREEIPADLLRPTPLAWNGLGIARCSMKLSEKSASLLEQALVGEQLLFHAKVELETEGISPRLPCEVSFDPAEMWNALKAMADSEGGIEREKVVDLFRKTSCPVALRIDGEVTNLDRAEFAEIMTDRVRMRFCKFVPALLLESTGYFALSDEAYGTGKFIWDLSEPIQAARPEVMFLHPLEAARELVRKAGIDTLRSRAQVPQLKTGVHVVEISANVPAQPVGIAALGVTVTAPPKKPFRPQAKTGTVELLAPDFSGTVSLLLSPNEPLVFEYCPYAVQEMDGRKLDGRVRQCEGDRVLLSPEDFPVRMIALELAPSLKELASSVAGVLTWKLPVTDGTSRTEFKLNTPNLILAVPQAAEDVTLSFAVTSRDGDRELSIGPMPAVNLTLGLHSFAEYGPHEVQIECRFNGLPLYAIDVLSENDHESNITVLSFTNKQPKKVWSWFAQSPFQAGFRYRKHTQPGEPTAPWSKTLGPFDPLQINAS